MGAIDKAKNVADDLKGKAKEAIGKVTDDEKLEAEARWTRERPTSSSAVSN